jgi:hypothetical protein
VFCTALRFGLIFLMMPLARLLGLKTSMGNASIISLGTIKGGFNIVLALVARFGLKDKNIADLFLFHTVLQLILTNLINMTLIGFIVRKYNLTNETAFDNQMLGEFLDSLDKQTT